MIGPARIFLALWLGVEVGMVLSGPPVEAQAKDQVVPNVVIADVLARLAPLSDSSDVLWSEIGGDMISLGVTIPALPADGDGVAALAVTLRDALWSGALGAVSVQPVINGVTLGARLQIAGSPVATLWTLRANSNSLVVLLLLPKDALAGLSAAKASGEPAPEEAPQNLPLAAAPRLAWSCTNLTALSMRIASGEKPRLTLYSYRTEDGGEFTTLEAGDPALANQTTRVVDSQGFFQFADARKALKKMLAASKCE